MNIEGRRPISCGFQQITSLSGSTALTLPSSPPVPVRAALITAEGQAVRYRDDGTAPTSTAGILIRVTDAPVWFEGGLKMLRFIQTAISATLNVSYYG